MSTHLPAVVENYLAQLLRERAHPLVLDFDGDWQLQQLHGDASDFGIDPAQPEAGVAMLQELFLGMPTDTATDLPFVELGDGRRVHVHLIPAASGWHVLLLDASSETQRAQALQQAGNEAALANQAKQRAIFGLHRIREQLERQRARLEEANALKGALIATLSHDFRTPLTAIFGQLHLLEQQHAHDPASLRALRMVHRCAIYLATLAENLLEYGRSENGDSLVNAVAVDIGELVRDLRAMFAPLAQAKGLALAIEFEADSTALPQFDEVKLRQILINLLSNAVRYTEHGTIHAALRWDGQQLDIRISDTGVGIPAEFHTRIFRPFNHGAQVGSKGAGLGLSIVKRLVQQLHGELSLQSEAGRGSCFSVRLPGTAAAAPVSPQAELAARHRARQLRVLIVDDDPDVADLLAALLEDFGFSVSLAPRVEPDLAQIWRDRPQLLLIDVELPGMSGNSAVQQLRANGYRGAIVTLSANASTSARNAALAAGSDEFVTKPLNIAQFLGTVARVVAD